MKKLLSILTITTLTASVPAPLLTNAVQTRVKRDVSTLTSNSNNDYLPIKEFKNIRGDIYIMTTDTNENIYFSVFANGAFVLKQGATTPTKINGITDRVNAIAVDSEDNIYYGTDSGAFVLKHGSDTPTKIAGISNTIQSISIDSKENIYFGTSKGTNILQTALSRTKQQSQFTVESDKTKTWTRPDLLSVGGELKIDIANPNIDKVVFDNFRQGQTNKHWTINVKPETAPRDNNLQVMFTLEGKQYTGEIIVSVRAKIESSPTPVQQNISELIKIADLGNILDNNDDTIFSAVNQKNGNVIDDFS